MLFLILKNPPDWHEILTYFRGSELQNYFTKLLEDDLKACIKPQYVDQIPRAVKGTVQDMLDKKDELKVQETIVDQFGKNFRINTMCIVQDGQIEIFKYRGSRTLIDCQVQLLECINLTLYH